MKRTILHCDLNNFYASVACHDHPELRGKPVAVCGDPKERHGIVLAKNMEAKLCGVKTAEAIWQAKEKCKDLITVAPDFPRYAYFSEKAREIYMRYSDLIEPFGPDEAWLDVTGSSLVFGSGGDIAEDIRKTIRRELGLTVSIGVSFNKVFAKLGSDLKKPDAISFITPQNFKEVVWPLPVNSMIGIGPATEAKLNSIGIYTLGGLAKAENERLKRLLGKVGPELKLYAKGGDTSRVAPQDYVRVPKSIGRSTTTSYDLKTEGDVWGIMLMLSEKVAEELRRYGLKACGVGLHLRTNELKVNELQTPLRHPCMLSMDLAKAGMELFQKNYQFLRPLRSLGIRAINLIPESDNAEQLLLFQDSKSHIKLETIERKMDELRGRFGDDAIRRGRILYNEIEKSAEKPFAMMYK